MNQFKQLNLKRNYMKQFKSVFLKSIISFSFASFLLVNACNNKSGSSDTTVVAPPAPTNQCVNYAQNYQQQNAYNYNQYNNYNYPYAVNPYGIQQPYGAYNANPLNTAVNSGACNNQLYNNYNQYGFIPYPNSRLINNYNVYNNGYMPLCNCPANYRPVYNGTMGMGCVAIQYFQPVSIGVYYWYLTPNNYQWVNWTQVSNIETTTTINSNYTNCYQQVPQSCFVDQPNSCGMGFICRPTLSGSRIGICGQ